jgi:choline transport protein
VIVTTVLFVFPPALPVTGSNMNYCIVAFFIVLVVATVEWFMNGRKHFKGPQVDIAALKNGEVVGITAEGSNTSSNSQTGHDLEDKSKAV